MRALRFITGVLAAALIAVALSRMVSAQDRDTLWTRATAEGRVVSLTWDKAHPWDAILTTNGAELLAKYFVQGGKEVVEPIARATVRPGDTRTVRFPLPETVRANPIGPVCLFLQLPDKRVLPIRRATAQLTDTAGFRYEAWDRAVRQRTQMRAAEEAVTQAQRGLTVSTQSIANQQATVASRGWTTLQACDTIPAPRTGSSARPFDAVPPAEQDDAARRVCVRQVWVADVVTDDFVSERLPALMQKHEQAHDIEAARSSLEAVFDSAFVGPGGDVTGLLDAIVSRLGADNATIRARAGQLSEFRRDWSRWSPTAESYKPQFGSATNYLKWPSTAAAVAFRIFAPKLAESLKAGWAVRDVPPPSTRDLESFVGASLDAYAGCVEDGRKQLKTKWDNWQAEQATAPQFAASARDFLVRECRQEVGLLDKLKTDRTAFEQQLARAQQEVTVALTAPALAAKPELLNGASCSQKSP
jgi:hypothetical protein